MRHLRKIQVKKKFKKIKKKIKLFSYEGCLNNVHFFFFWFKNITYKRIIYYISK